VRIEEIEEDVFVELESLTSLVLLRNNIFELTTRTFTFNPLVNVVRIDLERNLLTRNDDIFCANRNLTSLYLEYNQINEIPPHFTSFIKSSLATLNLRGNQCVDRSFLFSSEIDLVLLHNSLRSCFNNFVGKVSKTRRIALEFQGPLVIYDEFENKNIFR
jgi:Leucine-rich repeat (LRR) protein